MKEVKDQIFTGERAQYFAKDISYKNVVFEDGESVLKHGKNIFLDEVTFNYKYPLWLTEDAHVKNSVFHEMGRSGLWYTKNTFIEDSVIEAPKEFRRSSGIVLKNVSFTNAAETMWSCTDIKLEGVKAKGDYFAMNSSRFYAENFFLDGNYFLDGGKDIEIHNSVLLSKDAFWNCENVTVYDSKISGEYLAWHSKNVKFVNCTIESDQGLCYIENLVLENCVLKNTPLAFEYSSGIKADIKGKIESVKNPCSGKIRADEIGTLILNSERCNPDLSEIECSKIGKTYSKDPNPNENEF